MAETVSALGVRSHALPHWARFVACVGLPTGAYASFVIAMIIPINTNTTIAACSQIQVGDIAGTA